MRSLHRRARRRRFAAFEPRSSRLGIFYLIAILTSFGVIFRLILSFFVNTQQCRPVWDFWLSGWHQKTSLYQVIVACFVGLALLVLVDLFSWARTAGKKRLSSLIAYLALLAFPVWSLFVFYLFFGAMLPTTNPLVTNKQVLDFIYDTSFVRPYYGLPEGPFGTCAPGPPEWHQRGLEPDRIGAL